MQEEGQTQQMYNTAQMLVKCLEKEGVSTFLGFREKRIWSLWRRFPIPASALLQPGMSRGQLLWPMYMDA